ncbi:MAG: diversity-generating retroelement protein bAvd family protein [Acidobacteria bacterium]|nr:MAG: diversity-generating retroelement protein bAvd family protein [Acidobacteriota bacterium]
MRNYKDLAVWEKAHRLTLVIYKNTRAFPNEEKFGLTSQMRRASASIAANLAEGCGRRSDAEMGRFIQIAMGSGAELSYHLLLARDLGLFEQLIFEGMVSELSEIMRMMSSLSQSMKIRPSAVKVDQGRS